jgi:hypothetical protein
MKPKVKDIPLIALNGLDYDKSLLENEPDHSYHLFVDSPKILNDIMYNRKNVRDYTCKLTTSTIFEFLLNSFFICSFNDREQ